MPLKVLSDDDVVINQDYHEHIYRWPSLRQSSINSLVLRSPEKQVFAKTIAEYLNCQICLVFTSLSKCCHVDNCRYTTHCLDVYTEFECRHNNFSDSSSLCWHGENEFVLLAQETQSVIVSNSPSNDIRISNGRILSAEHMSISNIMIIPLIVSTKDSMTRVGFVMLANQKSSSRFDAQSYIEHFRIFSDLAQHLLICHRDNALKCLTNTLELQQQQHKDQIKNMSMSRDTFVATMSHEIRTPLNAVNGYNEILMRHLSQAARIDREILANALRSQRDAILHLTQLIGNILDFSKLRSKSVKLESKPFNIDDIITKAIDMCTPTCEEKSITLRKSIANEIPKKLVGDETRLYQIIMNLLTNAVKFTLSGSIDIIAQIQTSTDKKRENIIKISIVDTGRGVPVQLQKTLFEEFQQIRDITSTSSSVQGVGLGLAISKELVTLMGGTIGMTSDGRNGSTFYFTVCLRDSAQIDNIISEVHKNVAHCKGVLIIDDQEINRVLLTRMFLEWKFLPYSCASIEEAIHVLHAFSPDHFKLCIVDMDIAGESGLTFIRRICDDELYSHHVYVAASSIGLNFAGSDEFDAVHVKPIHPEELLIDISRLISNGPRRINRSTKLSLRKKRMSNAEKHILIVDDDRPSLIVAKTMLETIGCLEADIFTASSGNECLRILENDAQRSQWCIFMDIVMPEMSGIDCTKIIIQNPSIYGHPTIVALTADAVEATKTSMINAGAVYYLNKPISLDSLKLLMEKIQYIIGEETLASSPSQSPISSSSLEEYMNTNRTTRRIRKKLK